MPVERQEYNRGQERIHKRVDEIAKATAEIKTYSQAMKESSDRIYQAIYGNGRDGLIQKVARMFERSGLHTKLITFIFLSLVGIAFAVIKSFLGS